MLKNSSLPESIETDQTSGVASNSNLLSRRSFFKGSVGLAASAIAAGGLILPAEAQFGGGFREYIPYDATRDIHYGTRYGVIEHHYPEMNPTGEKFTFVRLKYPGGDWYTNIVNYYRWPSDHKFTEELAKNTTIDVEVRDYPQYVDIDDEGLFAYPFLYMTGHRGIRLSNEQVRNCAIILIVVVSSTLKIVMPVEWRTRGLRHTSMRCFRKVFPEKKLERLDISHRIYHTLYDHDEYPRWR